MKKNKAFTWIEVLVVIAIVAIIGGMIVSVVGNFAKLLFSMIMYFSIPAIIFGVALKLNQKHKWLVKDGLFRYELKNGDIIKKDIIQLNVWAFIITWPLYLPGVLAIIGVKEVYHRYLKHRFSIPEK